MTEQQISKTLDSMAHYARESNSTQTEYINGMLVHAYLSKRNALLFTVDGISLRRSFIPAHIVVNGRAQ